MKIVPGQMREIIQRNHPDRLYIPSESELRSSICQFIAQMKLGKNLSISGSRSHRSKLPPTVLHYMYSIFVSNVQIKPKEMMHQLQQKCIENHIPWLEGYSEEQFNNKCSSIKSRYSKTKKITDIPPLF